MVNQKKGNGATHCNNLKENDFDVYYFLYFYQMSNYAFSIGIDKFRIKMSMSPTVGGTYNVGSKWPPSMCRNTPYTYKYRIKMPPTQCRNTSCTYKWLHFMFKMGYTFVGRLPTLQQDLLEYCLHLATNYLFLFNSENVTPDNIHHTWQLGIQLLCPQQSADHSQALWRKR